MKFVQPIRDPILISRMLRALRQGSATRMPSERNWMLFMTGINTALRISDLLPLTVRDVTSRGNIREYIILTEKKTSKTNRILITPILEKALEKYIAGKQPRVCLFPSRNGSNRPITRYGCYKMLNKAAREVGIDELGTHTMRKTWAYFAYRVDYDIAEVMKALNHSNPQETMRYIGAAQDLSDKLRLSVQLGEL